MKINEVKRYDAGGLYAGPGEMVEYDDGAYVKYEDYAALKVKCDQLAALAAAFTEDVTTDATDVFSDTVVIHHDWDESGSWSYVGNETEVIRAVLDVIRPGTPATDAYLNSVRADAVVNAAAHLGDMAAGKSASTAELIKSCGRALLAFANQLRAGEPS